MSSLWSSGKHISSANSIIPDLILEELKQQTNQFILLKDDNEIDVIQSFKDKTEQDMDLLYKTELESAIMNYYTSNGNTHHEGINYFIHQVKKSIINSLYNTIDSKLIVLIQIDTIDELFAEDPEVEDTSVIFQALLDLCKQKLDRYNNHFCNIPLFVFHYTNDSVKKHSLLIHLMKTIRNTYFIDCIPRDISKEPLEDFNKNIEKIYSNKYFETTYASYKESLQNKQTNILAKSFGKFFSFGSDDDSKKSQQKKLEAEEDERNYESLTPAKKFEMFNKYKKLAIMNLLKHNGRITESTKSIEQCLKEVDDSVILARFSTMNKVSEYHRHLYIMGVYNKMFEHSITISDLYNTLTEFPLTYEMVMFIIPIVETVCHAGKYLEDLIRIYEFMLGKTPKNGGNWIVRGFFRDRITAAYAFKNHHRKVAFNTLLSLKEWREVKEDDQEKISAICEYKQNKINNFYRDKIFQKGIENL